MMRKLTHLSRMFGTFQGKIDPPPSFYNPNISLISNIGKSRQLSDLLSLHHTLTTDFTPKHLAQAARRLSQIIREHRSQRKQVKSRLLDRNHSHQFKAFLFACSETDMGTITAEEFINFTVFVQKLVKFQAMFSQSREEILKLEKSFKHKLLDHFDNRLRLEQCNFKQLCSIFNSTSPIMNDQQCIRLLTCLRDQLLTKPYCTCFHLAILSQMINERPHPSSSFSALAKQIQQVSEKQALSQFEQIKDYLCPRFVIQIFNGYFKVDKQAWADKIPLIIKQVHRFKEDKTMFARFFEKDLNYLEKALRELGPENKPALELRGIIQKGREDHRINHTPNPSTVSKQKTASEPAKLMFPKRKTP